MASFIYSIALDGSFFFPENRKCPLDTQIKYDYDVKVCQTKTLKNEFLEKGSEGCQPFKNFSVSRKNFT